MKNKRRVIIWSTVGAIVVAFILIKVFAKSDEELVMRTHVVGKYTVENTVTATGTIEPLEEVEVGTQVSGEISKIYVDYNSVVKEGQKVTFTVDAYIDDIFTGAVEQIRLEPTTTNNVVTYTVIITANNDELKLFPGMTASVTIVTEEQTGLAIPSEAMSFTPSERILKEFKGEFLDKREEMKDRRPDRPKMGGPRPEGMPNFKPGEMPDEPFGGPNMQGGERPQMVWVLENGIIVPRPIKTGMSDGVYRIVERGVAAGDSVVLSASYQVKTKEQKMGSNPFMPGPPGMKNQQQNKGNGRSSGAGVR